MAVGIIGTTTGRVPVWGLMDGDGGRDDGRGMLAGSGAVSRRLSSSSASCLVLRAGGGTDVARLALCLGGIGEECVEGVTDDSVIDEIVEDSSAPLSSLCSTGGDCVRGVRRSRDAERVWLCDRKGRMLTSNGLSESESSNVAGRRGTWGKLSADRGEMGLFCASKSSC